MVVWLLCIPAFSDDALNAPCIIASATHLWRVAFVAGAGNPVDRYLLVPLSQFAGTSENPTKHTIYNNLPTSANRGRHPRVEALSGKEGEYVRGCKKMGAKINGYWFVIGVNIPLRIS